MLKAVLISLMVIDYGADNISVISHQRVARFDTLEVCERYASGMDEVLAPDLYLIHVCSYD